MQIAKLKAQEAVMIRNISSLFLTAKAEGQRKDQVCMGACEHTFRAGALTEGFYTIPQVMLRRACSDSYQTFGGCHVSKGRLSQNSKSLKF